jgi:hypothetical protein
VPKNRESRENSVIKINRIAHKEEMGIIPNCPFPQPNPSNRMSRSRS